MTEKNPSSPINWIILIMVILCLGVSIYSLMEVRALKTAIMPQKTLSMQEFLAKLNSHPELINYRNLNPLNVITITTTNLPSLQGQITGLDVSYIGQYVIQYADRLVIYDLQQDKITGNLALPKTPVQQGTETQTASK
jgi:hypothetical protein